MPNPNNRDYDPIPRDYDPIPWSPDEKEDGVDPQPIDVDKINDFFKNIPIRKPEDLIPFQRVSSDE
jgi:hypothetical protein